MHAAAHRLKGGYRGVASAASEDEQEPMVLRVTHVDDPVANVTIDDDSDDRHGDNPAPLSFAERMMAKMGFRQGQGLGKEGQGRTDAILTTEKLGRAGLGSEDHTGLVRRAGMHVAAGAAAGAPPAAADSDLHVWVEWVSVGGALEGRVWGDEMRTWAVLRKVKGCDSLGDSDASPTADYAALASVEHAVALKATCTCHRLNRSSACRSLLFSSSPVPHLSLLYPTCSPFLYLRGSCECVCYSVCVCVRARARACVRACVRACACVGCVVCYVRELCVAPHRNTRHAR